VLFRSTPFTVSRDPFIEYILPLHLRLKNPTMIYSGALLYSILVLK